MSESTNEPTQKECFLTAPADRKTSPQEFRKIMIENASVPPLNTDQTLKAMNDLCINNAVSYPEVDRLYADPKISGQMYSLFSFIPAKGATPDKDGIFGMAKIRGSYDNQMELEQREEFLIRNVDSYHAIQRVYTGKPFPITTDSKFSVERKEIDIKKKTTEIISQDIKQQKLDEQREIKQMEERAQKLREDTGKSMEDCDPMDIYTTLVVKKAQLSFTYLEHEKKMEEIKNIIIKTRKEIAEYDEKSSEYKKNVYDKYMKAREESHLPRDDSSFIKYIMEDAVLPF